MAVTVEDALEIANKIGYPVMVRPSYVLGGRGMEVVHDDEAMTVYMRAAVGVTPDRPILIDRFLHHATECEADAISDGETRICSGSYGAYRAGRYPFRRLRLYPSVQYTSDQGSGRDNPRLHKPYRKRDARSRSDEHAVCNRGRRRYMCWRQTREHPVPCRWYLKYATSSMVKLATDIMTS